MLVDKDFLFIASVLGAGISMGVGAVGSAIGMGYTAGKACKGVTRQPGTEALMMRTMLIGMAMVGSPSIFALVIAMLLLFNQPVEASYLKVIAYLSAGICMGFGALGPGVGQGMVSADACENTAITPENANRIMNTMLVGQAVTTSTAIYSLVVAIVLMFVI